MSTKHQNETTGCNGNSCNRRELAYKPVRNKKRTFFMLALALGLVSFTLFTAFKSAPTAANSKAFEGTILYKVQLEPSNETKREIGSHHDDIMEMIASAGIAYSSDGGSKDIFAVETDSFMVKLLNDYDRGKSFINFAAQNQMSFNFSLDHAEFLGAIAEHDIKEMMEKEGAVLANTGTKRIAGIMCNEITLSHEELTDNNASVKIYLAPSIKTTNLLTEMMDKVGLEGMPLGIVVQAEEGKMTFMADQVQPGKVNSAVFKVIESGLQIPLNMKETMIPGLNKH